MKISIFDPFNQDIGIKLLFPEADYFIYTTYPSTINDRVQSYQYYNIDVKRDLSLINDKNYEKLFIILSTYDMVEDTPYFNTDVKNIFSKIEDIINNNNFTQVCLFDNYDFDYDPNLYIKNSKINYFFKRNYNKNKIYNDNVIPFPFIMFGNISIIEKLDREIVSEHEYFKEKNNRIFFTGSLDNNGENRDRFLMYNLIRDYIFNPGYLNYHDFLNTTRNSKYSLDLNGAGDPNKRTFEILMSGSLKLSQYNELKWPFENRDDFSDETIFKNEEEFKQNINLLENNDEIYKKCLENQYNIVKKYFNKEWIRSYITNKLDIKKKILFIKSYSHHKNVNFILKSKKINFTIINSINELHLYDLNSYDLIYSPCESIDVSKYPDSKFLFGPQFSVFPDNKLEIITNNNSSYNLLSNWVINIWSKSLYCNNLNLLTLPFGIETDKFINNKPINDRNEVIVYFKHRSPEDLNLIIQFLQKKNIHYSLFSYDERYDENKYIECLNNAKYGIWVDAHESQGFALQEALSCDVPLLVWCVKSMNQEYGSNYDDLPATTIPYWSESCGEVFYSFYEFEETFNKLNSNIHSYKPREFILNNLSIDQCENKLINFINNIHIK